MRGYRVGVVGATGAVGRELLSILEMRKFPISELYLYASQRSAGRRLNFCNEELRVEELKEPILNLDFVFFSAGRYVSLEYAEKFVNKGAIVIDNSPAFRLNPEIPLVVPEVNKHTIKKGTKLIANPNCSTIQLVIVLYPLLKEAELKRVVVTTYQSVSGTGLRAIAELEEQIRAKILQKDEFPCKIYPHPIAFNIFPHIGKFGEDGYCEEERKIIEESRKILELPDLKITATTARVPVIRCHCEALNIQLSKKLSAKDIRDLLEKAEGVAVIDLPEEAAYPTPLQVAGKDRVYVGRIREDESCEYGINLWIVGDNLRKGAALNAVQIAESIIDSQEEKLSPIQSNYREK